MVVYDDCENVGLIKMKTKFPIISVCPCFIPPLILKSWIVNSSVINGCLNRNKDNGWKIIIGG